MFMSCLGNWQTTHKKCPSDSQTWHKLALYGQGSGGGQKSVTWAEHFQVDDKLKIFGPKYWLKCSLSIMKMAETC